MFPKAQDDVLKCLVLSQPTVHNPKIYSLLSIYYLKNPENIYSYYIIFLLKRLDQRIFQKSWQFIFCGLTNRLIK